KSSVDFPVTESPGCIFVLGDNRNDSMDSRDKRIGNDGMVDTRYVLGRAVCRIYPFDDIGGLYNE
ncbi:MAG: signal peptidase I, partial [Clostridia bacterium]|nr:signal peptidase I [Clostridia bacterium]